MKLSMKIRAHEAEVLVVGTEVDEEQTSEIIRMSPSSADLPSRVAAELPLAGAPTQLHVEPQARTAPAFVSSEDGNQSGLHAARPSCQAGSWPRCQEDL